MERACETVIELDVPYHDVDPLRGDRRQDLDIERMLRLHRAERLPGPAPAEAAG